MVVVVGLTITPVPLAAVRLPGVMVPLPLANTAVRVELLPAVMVAGFAAKLVIVGAGGVDDADPPQPLRPPKPRLRARTLAAGTRARFTIFPLCNIFARKLERSL